MISSKRELKFYIMADNMMNRGRFCNSIWDKMREFLNPDKTMSYLRTMRKLDYYKEGTLKYHYYLWKYNKLGVKLGFSIAAGVFGYGLAIPHRGTIVVGDSNKIGNYAVLHTSTCITANGKVIGDGLFLSTGGKITTGKFLGNNVTIAANSVITKSFQHDNILLAGVPAITKCNRSAWYIIAGKDIEDRVNRCEELKKQMLF